MWLPLWTGSLVGAGARAAASCVVVGSWSAPASDAEKTKKGEKITGQ